MDNTEKSALTHTLLRHAEQLVDAAQPPDIPEELAENPEFIQFHEKMIALRGILNAFAVGDLSPRISLRGNMAGSCKALQANLRHMTWKVQQIEKGDYSQRMDFMGDFASSFNSMVVRLENTIEALRQKEDALTNLALSLQEEAKRRSATLQQLKKSEAEFKYLAQHDPLTDTLNRRFFFSYAQSRLEESLAMGYHCCVCLLDVDHFKEFNDTHGHIEGDKALKHIVEQARTTLRHSDIMGRYGGEEFIFFFTGSGLKQGQATAERIRTAIAQAPLVLQDGEPLFLRASFGVAEIPPTVDLQQGVMHLLEHAIGLADKALYRAKEQGRNQVCVAPQYPEAAR